MDNSDSAAPSAATVKRDTLSLRAFSFSMYSTQALLISYIPLYFMDQGFSAHQIGIIYSTGPFISIFANLLLGMASDRFQTIKKLLTILLFGQLAMISLLFPVQHFAIICLVMTAFYFFQTPMNPLSDSLLLLASERIKTPYALIRIFGSLGFAVSAYLFGFILKEYGSDWTLPLGLCTISVTIVLSFFLKDYRGSTRKIEFSGFFKLLRKPEILYFFFIILLVSISHRMNESFLAVALRQMGASDSQVGLAWLFSAISEIPVLFLMGKYGHKFKELPLLVFACLMYMVRFWLASVLDDPRLVLSTQLMHSVSFGIYFSTALRYLSQLIPDEYRSSGQAVYAVVWSGLAGLISGTLGGYFFEHFGRSSFYQMGAALALLSAVLFLCKHLFGKNNA
ncbi:MFS transporter, PPP family, 3-phenylpropionic acid transporter [Paenibacillus catalpae]|uniref:MFS transporter, PPP family, 3-phenylpropionic acid transporter n=1 Tax=Paenibacillus catalpae TaxID=1045775 RepID=A0A1I2EZP2_9BACL|nr:MFS transporter [Paenibacillus catalpae]SFE97906.1 MFS transporter, PPP family, 3-phenylpropionic acid transporter [Paenibacillus catalpae]